MNYKRILIIVGLLFSCYQQSYLQTTIKPNKIYSNKSNFYIGWGWNRSWYSKSDITFEGNGYDFVLQNVESKDRQSKFRFDRYLYPANMSIPQYNLRIGYFINKKYDISIGVDHMKYVMVQDQTVKIDGQIANSGTSYDKSYSNENIVLAKDFLKFEHTDGLNYLNAAIRKTEPFYSYKAIDLQHILGIEAGAMMPRTDATLLNHPRHDAWHLAGYGISAVQGINITFWKHLFIQAEIKEGFTSLPDIRTTSEKGDKASQHFFFFQYNWWIGGKVRI